MPSHYQGCTVKVATEWPKAIKIQEFWDEEGVTAAYIIVGNQIGYYNSLGERSFYGIEAPKALDERATQHQGAQAYYDERIAAFKAKEAEIKALTQLVESTEGNAASIDMKVFSRIEALMHHQHIPIYSIPITASDETSNEKLIVRLTPATEAVEKTHDQDAIEAQPQHLSYLIDTAKEQTLYLNLTHKGVSRTTATAVSLVQKSVAGYRGDIALTQESLEDYWQKTWGFQDSSKKSLAKIKAVSAFMQGLNGLTQPFTELESLINNAPKENPLATLDAAIEIFKISLEAKINALKTALLPEDSSEDSKELLPKYSQDLLTKFLTEAELKIAAFQERIAYLKAITPDATDVMRLFCAQNLDDPETLAEQSHVIPEHQKVSSLGKFENNLLHELLDVGINIVYDLTEGRLKQTLIKNPAVKHLAEAKEALRQQGSIYGARDVNTKEAIPGSMLQRQRLCAMDPQALASCQYLERDVKPTLQNLHTIKDSNDKDLPNAAYLKVGNDLYYVNKARGQCAKIGAASTIENLGLNKGVDLSLAQLEQITQKTGHSTKQWVSSQSLVSFAGDLSEQDEGICLLSKKKYHAKEQYLSQHTGESNLNTAYRIGHGIVTTAWWPVALSLEVAACGARVVLTILSAGVAIGSTKWADSIDHFGQRGHDWLSDTVGYAGTKKAANQYYQRTDVTSGDDHQYLLTAIADQPDRLFSNIANRNLSGSSTVRIMGEQIHGFGRVINNVPYEITHTFNSVYKKLRGQDWLTEPGLNVAVLETQKLPAPEVLSSTEENMPATTAAKTKAELALLQKFAAMNAYFEELHISDAIKKQALIEEESPPVRYENAPDMQLMRKADTDSILDFVDEVFVHGLCHTLINEMFNEAPLVSAVMFAVSLASFGIMTGFIAGPAALTYIPGIIGKSFTGQTANAGFVSASAANFLQFKLTSLAFIGLTKIYELDFKFLKSLGNHPEALLAFAALTAIGYGIGCLGHLPSSIPVTVAGHSALIPIEPLVFIPNAISPEAHEAIIGGVIPLISIELAFIGLKSLLFLDALASGCHHPDICATHSGELLAGIVDVLLLKSEDRTQAIIDLLDHLGVHLSESMMSHAVVVQFFDNIKAFQVANTAEARAHNLQSNAISSLNTSQLQSPLAATLPSGSHETGEVSSEDAPVVTSGNTMNPIVLANSANDSESETIAPVLKTNILVYKPKGMPQTNFTGEQADLKTAHSALSQELKLLQRYEALGVKVPKDDQERVYNHLDALYDQYNWRCREQGRHDLQLDKSAVLRDFLVSHCYQGTPTGARWVSSIVGVLWRPFKKAITPSPFILEKARMSDAKDALVLGHAQAIGVEVGRTFNLGVDGAARFMFSGFGLGALAAKGMDAMRNWYNGNTESTLYRTADALITDNIDLHNLKLPQYEQRQTSYANAARGSDKNSDLKAKLAADLTALAAVAKNGVEVYADNIRQEERVSPNIDAETNYRYTRAALRETAMSQESKAVTKRTSGERYKDVHAFTPLSPAEIRAGEDYHHNIACENYAVRMPPGSGSADTMSAVSVHHTAEAPNSSLENAIPANDSPHT